MKIPENGVTFLELKILTLRGKNSDLKLNKKPTNFFFLQGDF